MITEGQIRNRICKKIQRIPSDKLKELDEFVSKLDNKANKKAKNLSFAGSWRDIDKETFDEFTENLIDNRSRNRRRVDE